MDKYWNDKVDLLLHFKTYFSDVIGKFERVGKGEKEIGCGGEKHGESLVETEQPREAIGGEIFQRLLE